MWGERGGLEVGVWSGARSSGGSRARADCSRASATAWKAPTCTAGLVAQGSGRGEEWGCWARVGRNKWKSRGSSVVGA